MAHAADKEDTRTSEDPNVDGHSSEDEVQQTEENKRSTQLNFHLPKPRKPKSNSRTAKPYKDFSKPVPDSVLPAKRPHPDARDPSTDHPADQPTRSHRLRVSVGTKFSMKYWRIPGFHLGDWKVDLVQEQQPQESSRVAGCVLELSGDEAERRLRQVDQLKHNNVLQVLQSFHFDGSHKVVLQLVELCLDDIGTVCHVQQVLREHHFAIIFRQVPLRHLLEFYQR